ncbi:MAG: sigma-54-dependent Fis family transcriptional regulator [Deltaproteobacteria bacterium]|nr:sigma-54-dependent Fis family transcriptional regulator [Deltaproteobacteria bacterium]
MQRDGGEGALGGVAVLVADDEDAPREAIAELLRGRGYQVRAAKSGHEALEMLAGGGFDVALLDVIMPGLDGLSVLRQYRESGGTAPVVVLSALGGAGDAMRAMKLGATDYLTKPVHAAELHAALARALGAPQPAEPAPPVVSAPVEATAAVEPEQDVTETAEFVFSSPTMHEVRSLVDRVADTDVPVMILGESGVGKEVVARYVHARSKRAARPFIKINCAALPAELLESELFGHEKGAFTGATAEKPGKFELAHQGTIFLDEIGEMDIRLQAKLLQVLQDEEFFRVGGKRSVRVDARVVVATNRELAIEIERGGFREDLFYRLNVVAVHVPPLRERRGDIPLLAEHFLRKYSKRYRQGLEALPPTVLERFKEYDFPGNVRELENLVRRMVVLHDPEVVLRELRPKALTRPFTPVPAPVNAAVVPAENAAVNEVAPVAAPESVSLKEIGRRAAMVAEREAITRMLQRTGWNKRKAAQRLQISYKALLYKIKECGIVDPRDANRLPEDAPLPPSEPPAAS